mmetsp:Transcript_13008/g.17032  ORF Transcript_13008/g.17032 Transcript_13008/m.17032 type:complete len:208 (+) Transcript_13008:245-868(+)
MSNVVNFLGNFSWDANNTILVSNNGITWSHSDSRDGYNTIAFPWLHGSWSLACGGRIAEAGETIVLNLIRVTNRSVSDKTTNIQLLKTQKLNVTSNTFHFTNGRHYKNFVRAALFKCFVLWRLATRRFVLSNVRPDRDKSKSHCSTDTCHAGIQRAGIINLGTRPAHDPQTVNQGLCRQTAKLLQQFIRNLPTRRGPSGKRPETRVS